MFFTKSFLICRRLFHVFFFAFIYLFFCCRSCLTDECSRLIKVFLLRWKSHEFTSDGTVRIKGAGALARAIARAHLQRSLRRVAPSLAVPDGRKKTDHAGAHNNTVSVITITAIVTIIFIIIIIIISVIFQSQPGPPCCLCSALNQRNRRLVRCQIFDKSPQCSQRPWTRGQIPQLTKGDFMTRAGLVLRVCVCVHVHVRTEAEGLKWSEWKQGVGPVGPLH